MIELDDMKASVPESLTEAAMLQGWLTARIERLEAQLECKIANDAVEQAVCDAMKNGYAAGIDAAVIAFAGMGDDEFLDRDAIRGRIHSAANK